MNTVVIEYRGFWINVSESKIRNEEYMLFVKYAYA